MTQDKMRRIITACVSAGTVLFVFLLSFLIYQWITIANLNSKAEALESEIASLEQQGEQLEDTLGFYESELGKDWLLIQKGWVDTQKGE